MTGNYIGFRPTVNTSTAEGVYDTGSVFENIDYTTWPLNDLTTEREHSLLAVVAKNYRAAPEAQSIIVRSQNVAGFCFSTDGSIIFENYYDGGSPAFSRFYSYPLTTPFDPNTAITSGTRYTYFQHNFTIPSDIQVSPDGKKVYVLTRTTSNSIYQFTLSTPWQADTASYDNVVFSVNTQENLPTAFTFKPDGLKMYVIGTQGDDVNEYTLSQAWNVATASYTNVYTLPTTRDTAPCGLTFNNNGTRLLVSGNASTINTVYQYNLPSAYDLSTMVFEGTLTFSNTVGGMRGIRLSDTDRSLFTTEYSGVSSTFYIYRYGLVKPAEITPYGMFSANITIGGNYTAIPDQRLFLRYADTGSSIYISPDGTKGYFLDSTKRAVFKFNMATSFDTGAAIIDDTALFVTTAQVAGTLSGLQLKSDGTKVYMYGTTTGFAQFALSTAWDLSTATLEKTAANFPAFTVGNITSFRFNSDGTQLHVLGTVSNRHLATFYLNTPWDIASFSLNYGASTTTGISYSSNGSILYTVETSNDRVHQLNLGEPFNPNWIVSQSNVSIVSQEPAAVDICLGDNGTKFYVVGTSNRTVYQYNMSTPYDVTTGVYSGQSSNTTLSNLGGLSFKKDGTAFYVTSGTSVVQFTMSQAWNVATAVSGSFDHSTRENNIRALRLSANGHRAYTITNNFDANRRVNQFNLSTSYDITTASYASNTLVNTGGTTSGVQNMGMVFSPNGSFLVTGNNNTGASPFNAAFYKYFLSTPWDISTATLSENTAQYTVFPNYFGGGSKFSFAISDDGYLLYTSYTINNPSVQWTQPYGLREAWNVRTLDTNTTFYAGRHASSGTMNNLLDVKVSPDGNNIILYQHSTTAPLSGRYLTHYRLLRNNYVHTANTGGTTINPNFGTFTDGSQHSMTFSANGHKLFVLGQNGTSVAYEYSLPTPYSLVGATATVRTTAQFTADPTQPVGIAFSNTGSYVYTTAYNNATSTQKTQIRRYYLHTPWDLSSVRSFIGGTVNSGAVGIKFSANGHRMYIANSSNRIIQYDLRVNFDPHSATYNTLYAPSSDSIGLADVEFNGNGTIMYTTGSSKIITMYNLSEAWNIASASISTAKDLTANFNSITGIALSSNGTLMYVSGTNPASRIGLITLLANGIVNSSALFVNSVIVATQPESIALANNDSTIYYGDTTNDRFYQYNMTTAGNIASLTLATFQAAGNILQGFTYSNPAALHVSADGRYLWTTDNTTNAIYQFYMTNAGGILSMKPVNSTNASMTVTGDASIIKIEFSHDGNRFYALGATSDTLVEFDTLAPFDTTTLTYTGRTRGVGGSDIRGFSFSGNGTFLYSSEYSAMTVSQFGAATTGSNGYLAQTYFGAFSGVSFTSVGNPAFPGSITLHDFYMANSTTFIVTAESGYIGRGVLSVPYLISSVDTTRSSTLTLSGTPAAFSVDEKLYVSTVESDKIIQYYIPPSGNIALATPVNSANFVNAIPNNLTAIDIDGNGNNFLIASATGIQGSVNTFGIIQTTNGTINSTSTVNTLAIGFMGLGTYGVQGISLHGNTITNGVSMVTTSNRIHSFGFRDSNTSSIYPTSISSPFTGTLYNVLSDFDIKQSNVLVFESASSDSITELVVANTNNLASTKLNYLAPYQESSITSIYLSSNNDLYFGGSANNIYRYELATTDDLSTFYSVPPNSGNLGRNILGITFKTDGTKLYIVDASAVYQYALSTAWNPSTAVYESKTFSFAAQTTGVAEIYITSDGTRIFVNSTTAMFSYTMSTPWDVSTATYDTKTYSTTANTQSSITAFTFKPDGTKMYVTGAESQTAENIIEFNLGTAWDLTTAVYSNTWFSDTNVRPSSIALTSIEFNSGGTKLFGYGSGSGLRSYTLSTPYDVSTLRRENVNFSVVTESGAVTGVTYAGNSVYLIDSTGDRIVRLESFSNNNLQSLANTVGGIVGAAKRPVTETLGYDGYIKPDGTKIYWIGTTNDRVYQYTLSTPFDVGSATYDYIQSNTVTAQDSAPQGIFFKSDGTTVYVLGDGNNRVYQYNLTEAWNVATMAYSNYFANVAGNPLGLHFNNTGTSFYYSNYDGGLAFQYNMSQAWNVATAVYVNNVGTQNSIGFGTVNSNYGISLSSDGTYMYISNTNDNKVFMFKLSQAGNVATARPFTSSLQSPEMQSITTGIFFSANGDYFYSMARSPAVIKGRKLSVPWDIRTTAGKLDLATGETSGGGIEFKSDGTVVYVIGSSLDAVFSYPLPIPYQINSFVQGTETAVRVASANITSAYDIKFSSNGSLMYINEGIRISQFNLSQAWNVETAVYQANVIANNTPGGIQSIDFSSNGTILYTGHYSAANTVIARTTLSQSWNVLTANAATSTFYRGASVFANSTTGNLIPNYVYGINWSKNGRYLTMVGGDGAGTGDHYIAQIQVKTPFTLTDNSQLIIESGYTVVDSAVRFSFQTTGGTLGGQADIHVVNDGSNTKLFILNTVYDQIDEYNLYRG